MYVMNALVCAQRFTYFLNFCTALHSH
jgi:hypothetical protein